ncbi:hypothetical protein L7F22_002966 [Adiantum nelumboides]|nr:hypothetical protein [Adiantum nelumboides]
MRNALISMASRAIAAKGRAPAAPFIMIQHAFYHENVVDHYNNPRNVGSFDKNDPNVGTGLVGAPACGDVMKLQIRVDPETGKIVDSCFKTFGCGSAIASSSVVRLIHTQIDDVANLDFEDETRHPDSIPVHGSVEPEYDDEGNVLGATEWIKGKPMDDVLTIRNSDIAKHLALPPVKLHCSMLAEDAIKAAVKDFKTKNVENGSTKKDAAEAKA